MEFRGRVLFMMILIIVTPVVIAGAVSYRLSVALHNQHVAFQVERTLQFEISRLQKRFEELRRVLGLLAETVEENEGALRKRLVEVEKEFVLRDVMAVRKDGTVIETASSPEAAGQSITGDLFVNTPLPSLFQTEKDAMTDFSRSEKARTGFMVAFGTSGAMDFVAEFGRETIEAISDEGADGFLFYTSVAGTDGRLRAGRVAIERYGAAGLVAAASETVEIEGIEWIVYCGADPAIDGPLMGLQKSILILSAGVGFVALLLAWTMLRSMSVLASPVESGHLRGQRVHEIAIAASALDARGRIQAMEYIRKLIRESPGQYTTAPDEPIPIEDDRR